MTEQDLKKLACELSALTVFRGVRKKEPLVAFLRFLESNGRMQERMDLYAEFVSLLSYDGYHFSDFLRRVVYEDENPYIVGIVQKKELPSSLVANAKAELALFSKLTMLRAETLWESMDYDGFVPRFENEEMDFERAYAERIPDIGRYGYGIFSTAKMFRLSENKILPIENADDISLDNFVGYEKERQKIFDNTKALVEGKPAANVLLFGDAGTGKSSTVKACANYFYNEGVRLIELRKDQLFRLPCVMDKIVHNPLKFIIFIDDLSFQKNDDCFSMLKAALEGSASAKAKNAVIYATSNRRHMVREKFSERANGDDVHPSDTIQEMLSLSDRFGLTVYFSKPSKTLYLEIVHCLAEKNGILMEKEELDLKAETFALNRGSRSPRAAEQFINSLMG